MGVISIPAGAAPRPGAAARQVPALVGRAAAGARGEAGAARAGRLVQRGVF